MAQTPRLRRSERTEVPLRRNMLRRLQVLSRIQAREMCFHFTEVREVKWARQRLLRANLSSHSKSTLDGRGSQRVAPYNWEMRVQVIS